MTLAPGTRLGPYDIVAPLGAGGMGEVYRARDARLVREVAVKILPDAVAADPELLARFQREAQVLAALNHPHIASIYGLEETGGRRALVLELVEGETLAVRIAKGALPVEEALPIAIEIADALETAHEQGIVHRDLKPANVMLTPEGRVKVLDFGLAKALTEECFSPDVASSPTLTATATQVGVVIGTAAYMSPEQARGKSVDKRADLWSFGCVLYEMLSGKRTFEGDTVSDTLAAILRAEPDFARLPNETPASVRELLRRALQKDPRQRLRDAGDARLELEEAAKEPRPIAGAMPEQERRGWGMRRLGLAGAAIAIALVVGTAAGLWMGRRTAPQPAGEVVRLEMPLAPADMLGPIGTFQRPFRPSFAVTPDGPRVVFAGVKGDTTQLYVRSLDAAEAVPIPGTAGADTPFVSPDGAWVGFLADGEIRKTRLAGGPVVKVADLRRGTLPSPSPLVSAAQDFFGASWGDDDVIVFGRFGDGLWQVPAAGGEPKRIIRGIARLPRVLPGGKGVLFTHSTSVGGPRRQNSVAVTTGSSGEPRTLVSSASDARYLPPDRLLFVRDGVLMTISFDLDRLSVSGSPTALVDGILHATGGNAPAFNTQAAFYEVTPSGTLVFADGGVYHQSRPTRLVWVTRDGAKRPIEMPAGYYMRPRLSPDGHHLAVQFRPPSRREKGGIFTFDFARGAFTGLTRDEEGAPLWTADGTEVYFLDPGVSPAIPRPGLSRIRIDRSGSAEQAVAGGVKYPSSVSQDGSLLAFIEGSEGTGMDIWLLPLRGDRTPRPWLKTPANESWAEFSPDGKFMAYGSDVSGRFEVYVQPFPGPGPRHQISLEGGDSPLWSKNGRELFFAVRDAKGIRIMAVEVTTSGSAFSAGRPHPLFTGPYSTTSAPTGYDIAADGKSFLMVEDLDPPKQPTTRLHVVLNWLGEVRRAIR